MWITYFQFVENKCIVCVIILSLVRCFVFTLRQPGCQMIVGIISFPDLRKMRQGQKMKRQKYGFHFFGTSNFWDQFQLKVVACFYVINCGQTMSEWDKGKGGQGKYKAGLERDGNSSFENFFCSSYFSSHFWNILKEKQDIYIYMK